MQAPRQGVAGGSPLLLSSQLFPSLMSHGVAGCSPLFLPPPSPATAAPPSQALTRLRARPRQPHPRSRPRQCRWVGRVGTLASPHAGSGGPPFLPRGPRSAASPHTGDSKRSSVAVSSWYAMGDGGASVGRRRGRHRRRLDSLLSFIALQGPQARSEIREVVGPA